uniref:Aminotransferase-like plant mobile domain-containing protein n=1 Tax=Fagus sylvatica TaxID=28930 RepID=A0A2N9G2R3_FAGSY
MDDLGIIPGPIDASVLTLQAKHRSTDIWNNDMGGDIKNLILHCRRREAVLSRSNRPHPRIVSYLQRAGFYGLYCLRFIQLDWALISAFVERWRPETHTFHLPLGEMTITLQDMEVMLGLPVDGRPVIRSTILKWPELCGELLGVIPPPEKLVGCRLNMTWLSETFGVLPDNADEVTVQRYARAYILEMLGGSVFADTSGDLVHLLWLMFLDDFDTAGEYSWGSAALAWLYRQLCNAAKARTKDIGGALILVQLWAWSRFPRMTPEIVSIQPIDYGVDAAGQPLPQGPYGIRWCNAKCQKNVSTHVLRHYRSALGMQHPDEIVWQPYINANLPDYCLRGREIWRTMVPLICVHIVEMHCPDRVLRQFGMQQSIPRPINTYVTLHAVTLRKKETDWTKKWESHVDTWNNRLEHVITSDIVSDPMSYNDEYMVWYRRITRRYISKQSASFDALLPLIPHDPPIQLPPIPYSPPIPVTLHPIHPVTPHPAQSTHPVTPHPTHPVTPHPVQSTYPDTTHPAQSIHPDTTHPAQSIHPVTTHPAQSTPVTTHPTQPTHSVSPHIIDPTHLVTPVTTHFTPPPITPYIEETPTGSTQTYSPPPSLISTTVTPDPIQSTHPVTLHPIHPVTPHPAQSTHPVTPHPTHPVTPHPVQSTYPDTTHPAQSIHPDTTHPAQSIHPVTTHPAQSTPVTTHPTQPTHSVSPHIIDPTHLVTPVTTHFTPPPITPYIEETPTGSTQTYSPPPSLIPTTVPPAPAPLAEDGGRRRNPPRNVKARGCGTSSAYHQHYKNKLMWMSFHGSTFYSTVSGALSSPLPSVYYNDTTSTVALFILELLVNSFTDRKLYTWCFLTVGAIASLYLLKSIPWRSGIPIFPEHQQLIVDTGALSHLVGLLKRHKEASSSRAVNSVIHRAEPAANDPNPVEVSGGASNGNGVGGGGGGGGTKEVPVSVKVAMEKAKEYKVNKGVVSGGKSDTISVNIWSVNDLTGERKWETSGKWGVEKKVNKKKELSVSNIDFIGLEFADKKSSRGLPPGLAPIADPFPVGDLPEVEFIVGDTSRFEDTTSLKPELTQEGDSDLYKPKVSSWGVFPRPNDISKTFGGGRVIRPGEVLETAEEKAARETRTRQLLAAYKSKIGLNIDPKLKSECEEALKDGDSLMNIGKLKEALPYYEKVMDKLTFQSELHGLAALQWSICQDSLNRPNEARVMYESLQSHPNARVLILHIPAGLELLLGLLSSTSLKQQLDGAVALFKLANKSMALSPVDAAPPSPTPQGSAIGENKFCKAYLVFINASVVTRLVVYSRNTSQRRIQCLKYLVLANMLMESEVNPIDVLLLRNSVAFYVSGFGCMRNGAYCY